MVQFNMFVKKGGFTMAVCNCKCRIDNGGFCTGIEKCFLCPRCGKAVLKHYDYHLRSLKFPDESIKKFYLERRQCPNPSCRTTHVLIPDFMVLNKHYGLEEIKRTTSRKFSISSGTYYGVPSVSTISRWKRDPEIRDLSDQDQ